MSKKKSQRIISLGFLKPRSLKKEVIYVDFIETDFHNIITNAYSEKSFIYPIINFTREYRRGKKCSSCPNGNDSTQIDSHSFLDDLIEKNNGKIDMERLIPEGAKLNRFFAKNKSK